MLITGILEDHLATTDQQAKKMFFQLVEQMTKTYRFVPLQDFTKSWTDAELYEKYELTDEEIAFIEATIKPME